MAETEMLALKIDIIDQQIDNLFAELDRLNEERERIRREWVAKGGLENGTV